MMDYTTLQQGDIVKVSVASSFCGLPAGIHQGVVVDLEQDGRAIAFTDIKLLERANRDGVWSFLNYEAFNNCDIEVLCESKW